MKGFREWCRAIVAAGVLWAGVGAAWAVLPAPQNFRANPSGTPGGWQFYWDAVPGAATYNVLVDDVVTVRLITSTASAPGSVSKMVPGYSYKWEVQAVDPNGEAGAKSQPILLYPAPYSLLGTRQVLVALVDWPDWSIPYTPESFAPFLADIEDWYLQESDQQFGIDFTVMGWREAGVTLQSLYDASTNPQKFVGTDGTLYGIQASAVVIAQPMFPERSQYTTTIYVMNGVGEVGGAGGDTIVFSAQHSITKGTWLHELGHTLGLMHTGGVGLVNPNVIPMWEDLLNPDNARWALCRYCSQYDPMGAVITFEGYDPLNPPPMSYAAFKKVLLGWAALEDIQYVPAQGGTYLVAPVEEPSWHQKIMLEVALGSIKGMFYEVSYSQALERVFVRVHTPMMGGAINPATGIAGWGDDDLYQVRARGASSPLELRVGETYEDVWRGIRVYFEGVFGGQAIVTVTSPTTPVGGNPHPRYFVEE